MSRFFGTVFVLGALTAPVLAGEEPHTHHVHHSSYVSAPIGVMGDHLHPKGEWMLSYRYMHMNMSGLVDGDSNLTPAQVLGQGFMVSPTSMTIDMHMFGVMYGASEPLTFMAMIPYLEKEMDHVTGASSLFTTNSKGLGDLKVSGLYDLHSQGNHQFHLNAGVSFPTGKIDERDDTPAAMNAKLPYPMQLGSGTVDLMPGITYTGAADNWSWGAQYAATFRLGTNDEHYSLGDNHTLTAWTSYAWNDSVRTSVRLKGQTLGDIDGADPDLNSNMVPTANSANHGGERLDLSLGLTLMGRKGALRGHSLGFEVSAPIYLDLNGPQMEPQLMATIGWKKEF